MDDRVFKLTPEMDAEMEAELRALNEPARQNRSDSTPLARAIASAHRPTFETRQSHDPAPALALPEQTNDPVDHPQHYTVHPSGIECISVTEWMTFNLGNCVKYIWRADHKGATIQDLEKARWYLDREISRLKGLQ